MAQLRFGFNGVQNVQTNYSQAGQDLFVLAALNGKTNGTYLEVGAGPAMSGSNTYLLEKTFNWRGASVEYNNDYYSDQIAHRSHHIELADATKVNYSDLLARANITETDIDYASLDIDEEDTLRVLYSLPMDTHRFAVITFEHDSYVYGPSFKNRSREYLFSRGYELMVSNVSTGPGYGGDFEDWWVHPALVDAERIAAMRANDDAVKYWFSYIFL